LHETLRLFGGDSFPPASRGRAGVVDGYVDAAAFGDGGIHSPPDRGVVGHIQFKDVYWQQILFCKGADFGCILRIAASGIAHRRENDVPFASECFGEQSAKAGTGTGDENYLLGMHDLCLLMALP